MNGAQARLASGHRILAVAWLCAALLAPTTAQTRQPSAENSGMVADAEASPVPLREALDGALREVLARPDFKEAMRGGGHDPRDIGQWLLLHIRRLLGRLGGLHETNYGLFLVSVIVGSVLLVAIFAHIAYTIAHALRPRGWRAAEGRPTARERLLSPDELRRESEAQVARGEFREAVRALYLALLRGLQLRGTLPRTNAQTNREHLGLLGGQPRLLAVVAPFTDVFDAKWYGRRPASREDVEQCRRWLEAALQEVEAE